MKIHITFFLTCFKQLLIEEVAFWIPILNSSVPLLILKIFLHTYDCTKFGNILKNRMLWVWHAPDVAATVAPLPTKHDWWPCLG